MTAALWFIILGSLFILMGLATSVVKRLPLTTGLLYMTMGIILGPHGVSFFHFSPEENSSILERATEIVVIISLFAAGLKLRTPWDDPKWKLAVRLAFLSMVITVVLVTGVAYFALGLPIGAAVLLGGILAPTDPVLASDVQVKSPKDQDRLRFSLTGEAGLNDGTAFPFVMLGLGLLGLHDIGEAGWKWILRDVLWAVPGGLIIGAGLGTVLAHLVISLRHRRKETIVLDDFLALGLIALSYGTAVFLQTYGFLSVFAAGLALRRIERLKSGEPSTEESYGSRPADPGTEELNDRQDKVPAYTAQAVLLFNEQLERLGEVGMVLLLGGMIRLNKSILPDIWFVPLHFLLIRPVSVVLGLWKSSLPEPQVDLIAWFGIRGIGSLYYLVFSIEKGLPRDLAAKLTTHTLTVVAISIVVHGLSVTPLMNLYTRKFKKSSSESEVS